MRASWIAIDADRVDPLADAGQRDRQRVHREARVHAGAEHRHLRLLRQLVDRCARSAGWRRTDTPAPRSSRRSAILSFRIASICGMHLLQRRLRAQHDDVGLRRLDGLPRIVRYLDAQLPADAGDVAEIAADLGRIDVDARRRCGSRVRVGDLPHDGRADRARGRSAGRGWGLSLRSCTTPEMNDADPQIILRWYRIRERATRSARSLRSLDCCSFHSVTRGLQPRHPQPSRSPAHCRPATPAIASTRRLDVAAPHDHRPTKCSPGATLGTRRGRRCSFTSTATPGGRRVDVDARARGSRIRRPRRTSAPGDWASIDISTFTNRRAAARSRDLTAAAALHRARRRQRGRPDGGGGAARHARRAGRHDRRRRSPGPRTCRARSRGPARSATTIFLAQWFPKLGVLQDSGWNCHQFHAATEFFSDFGVYDVRLTVPRGWIVGATGVERDVTRRSQTARRRIATTRTTSTTSRGRRARDYRRAARDVRAPDAAAGRDAPAAAARARGPGGAPFRRRRAPRCKYYGEWFGAYPYGHITIVDPAWQSGAGGMEYPTLFTAGTRWLAPRHARRSRRRDRPRGRPPVLVRHRRHQRVRARVDGRRAQHLLDRARDRAAVRADLLSSMRYFGGFVPWVFQRRPLSREIDGDRLGGYRRTRGSDVPVDADVPLLARHRRRDHLQQDRALAAHARALSRLADAAADAVDLLRALRVQAPRAAGLLRRRQRGQRPDLTLVLRSGVSRIADVRLRRRLLRSDRVGRTGITPRWSRAGTATACFPSRSG